MKRSIVCLSVLLAAGWCVSGCGEKEEEDSPMAISSSGLNQPSPDSLVAKVNGEVINVAMLNQQLNAIMQQYAQQVPPDQLSKLQPMLRQQAVASLVNQSLLLEEAVKEGITPTAAEIDAEIEKIVAQFPSREQFDAQMAQAGVTEADLRRDLERNLKIRTLIEKQIPEEEEVTEEEVKVFYEENSEQFQHPEQVEASHILIKFDPEDTEEDKNQKRAKLEGIQKEIGQGADFAELATENSDDIGSASNGGDLGYFGRGVMIPAFEEVAFALGTGEVSDIVETQFGYHLIKVTGRKDAGVVPLEEVEEQVTLFLDNQNKEKVVGDYLQELRSAAVIEYGPGFEPAPRPQMGEFPPPQPQK